MHTHTHTHTCGRITNLGVMAAHFAWFAGSCVIVVVWFLVEPSLDSACWVSRKRVAAQPDILAYVRKWLLIPVWLAVISGTTLGVFLGHFSQFLIPFLGSKKGDTFIVSTIMLVSRPYIKWWSAKWSLLQEIYLWINNSDKVMIIHVLFPKLNKLASVKPERKQFRRLPNQNENILYQFWFETY